MENKKEYVTFTDSITGIEYTTIITKVYCDGRYSKELSTYTVIKDSVLVGIWYIRYLDIDKLKRCNTDYMLYEYLKDRAYY